MTRFRISDQNPTHGPTRSGQGRAVAFGDRRDDPDREPGGPFQDPSEDRPRRRDPHREQGPNRPPSGPKPPLLPTGRSFRTLSIWLLVALAIFVIVQQIFSAQTAGTELNYFPDFWNAVEDGRVEEVTIVDRMVTGKFREAAGEEPKRFHTYLPSGSSDEDLMRLLRGEGDSATDSGNRQPIRINSKPDPTPWFSVLLTWLPFILLIGLWFFLIRQMQSGGSAALKFGKSKAKLLHENKVRVTFDDVAGADEAKAELEEIIEFLREPSKFRRLGGRIPKGVLLVGPPGTGKTLLARAVAGEAGVPFFSISGSDFVEMFVGVGAARVRDLFEQGKRNAPCIVFVDELDAVGRHRGAGLGGGHDEREQTLNQLLVEMDGFEANEGVILLAATNRPDVLDPALLRPGRFDRQVVVDRPDIRGREGIIKVHIRGKPLAEDVDVTLLARGTPGLAGADLENMINEAALLAARRNQSEINMVDFEEAKDKVMMGTERRSLVISDREKKVTAYHEAGHVLVSWFLPDTDPIHKVTVIPRGRALGLTHSLPEDDRYTEGKEQLEQRMAMLMGGRAAEEMIFGRITTGATGDISMATDLARKMVCAWGMSAKVGPIKYGKKDELIFLGKELSQHKDFSEHTAELIDEEVNHLVMSAYKTAQETLNENEHNLHALAKALLEREMLDHDDIEAILGDSALDQNRAAEKAEEEQAGGTAPEDEDSAEEEPAARTEESTTAQEAAGPIPPGDPRTAES